MVSGLLFNPALCLAFGTQSLSKGRFFVQYPLLDLCNVQTGDLHVLEHAFDLLNFPGQYIESGDWVVSEAPEITSPDDSFELEIDFQFLEDGDVSAASR